MEITKSIIKKFRRKIWSKFVSAVKDYNLIEEMADVVICLQFLKDNYNISKEDLIKSINTKIDRIDNRIKGKIE